MLRIEPEDVTSPQGRLRGGPRVIYDGDWAASELIWADDGVHEETALGIRWNGDEENPRGFPSSGSQPVWFIVPKELVYVVRGIVDDLNCPTNRKEKR